MRPPSVVVLAVHSLVALKAPFVSVSSSTTSSSTTSSSSVSLASTGGGESVSESENVSPILSKSIPLRRSEKLSFGCDNYFTDQPSRPEA